MGLVHSQDVFKPGIPINYEKPCVNNGTYCSNSATCNITVYSPNLTAIINNQAMTNNGAYFNYTIPAQTQISNLYSTAITCKDGNNQGFSTFQMEINPLGAELDGSKASLYIAMLLIGILMFIGSIIAAITIPADNPRDQMTGYVLAVSNIKYVKIILWGIAYLLLMLIMWTSYIISFGLLNMDFLGSLFQFAFYTMVVLVLPLIVLLVYLMIANAVRDSEISKLISGGFKTR
jgi:hypothetical protein